MVQQVSQGFCRSLEWMFVAMVYGCTLWVGFLVLGIGRLAG